MKKILIPILLFIASNSFGQYRALIEKDTTGLVATKANISVKADTSSITQTADYVIEKVGSTYYARPAYKSGLPAYSGTNFKTVIESAMGQLISGGLVFIKAQSDTGVYPIVIPFDNITIQGAGKYLTTLKLRSNADTAAGLTWTGLIQCIGHNNFTIKDIGLDGNGANQTKIDNGSSQNARLFGIRVGFAASHILIDNCYVHDFTVNGIQISTASDILIKNCRSENNNWNGISIAGSTNALVTNCTTLGSGDVGISVSGQDIKVSTNTIGDLNGIHGSVNSAWGIELGVTPDTSTNITIENNTITGASITKGIENYAGTQSCFIKGNYFHDLSKSGAVAILIYTAKYFTISDNKILRVNGQGILLNVSTTYCEVSHNNIGTGTTGADVTGSYGISIDGNSTYNKIINNVVINHYAMNIVSGSNNNYVSNNIFQSTTGWNHDFSDASTGTISKNNILFGLFGATNSLAPETVNLNFPVTALVGGVALSAGSQNITVTSANSTYIVFLPTSSATTIGMKVTGQVGANGFKLGVASSQASTVYLNGVTTSVYGSIPANSSFEAVCLDATHWILKVWSSTGNNTVITPA
jgi:hypothetical protein